MKCPKSFSIDLKLQPHLLRIDPGKHPFSEESDGEIIGDIPAQTEFHCILFFIKFKQTTQTYRKIAACAQPDAQSGDRETPIFKATLYNNKSIEFSRRIFIY
jgi:hypothetical protein